MPTPLCSQAAHRCPTAVQSSPRVFRCGWLLIGAAVFRKEKDLASLKLQKGKMLDKRRCVSSGLLVASASVWQRFGRRSTPSHFTKATDTRNTLYVLRWTRAVQSLDTMAVVHAGQESEPNPAAPAGESAASSQAEGGKKTKVSIDMDEL